MKKLLLAFSALALVAILLLTGCSASDMTGESSSSTAIAEVETGAVGMDQDTANNAAQDAAAESAEISADDGDEQWQDNEAKIIRTVDMGVETLDFDSFISSLKNKVEQAGGYVQSSMVDGKNLYADGRENLRHAYLTLRIPQEKLDSFLSEVSEQSNVLYQNEYAEDISLTYYDTESRRNALEVEQERLLSLLEQADDIEAIIRLEERLTEVRRQLESYTSSLKQYDNMVDYSTVDIQIEEVKSVTEVQGDSFFEKVGHGIGETMNDLGTMCVNIALFLIVNLPYILIIGVIIIIIVLILRKRRKHRKIDKATTSNEGETVDRGTEQSLEQQKEKKNQ